jgi:hypothetical protein
MNHMKGIIFNKINKEKELYHEKHYEFCHYRLLILALILNRYKLKILHYMVNDVFILNIGLEKLHLK